ncbi:hypothetical protein [Rhodococcus sp. RCBS9]|uniref:hypothetical protein n=1 Tax=Rhodococcus sp. RCBS9 TaxID=3031999 RepID=UPI0024028A7B|nr:hypothetical protein [Rhodococcus sp. RCBS9]WEX03824.1 hypothetical protein P0M12_30170 [Rhodococcus sp. RCBS9]WEX03903.1 hypothetical protein P0M12_00185 [Rhodococcus sp. RCBS9]
MENYANEWEIWRAPEGLKSPTITLIFDREYFDFDARLFEANKLIQKAYQIDSTGLAERITSLSADLFFVRIQQFSSDGTIPFKQAQRALDNISTMVRAAATTVASPSHSHQGRRPVEVEDFLSENLRLGHTKKGSFVVTAVARFDDEPSEFKNMALASETDEASDDPPIHIDREYESDDELRDAVDDPIMPFGRRVMRTLSRGLDAARKVASDETSIGLALEEGLSLELAEALQRISSEPGLQTIDVTFDWSPSVPQPTSVPERVVFEQKTIQALAAVTEALQIHNKPQKAEILGSVIGLSRSLNNGEPGDSGPVTILADVDGHLRKVTVNLEGEEHRWAIRAYQDHFPVLVEGELVKRGSWRLEGAVALNIEAARQFASVKPKTQSAIESSRNESNDDDPEVDSSTPAD